MTRQAAATWNVLPTDEERLRPLYSRLLRLRHVNPGGLLCFVFFEGAISLAVLLGLAELVSWWSVLLLPASVALMVKINDEVAAAVARSAARVPEVERDRFRRELEPAVGRAPVPEALNTIDLDAAGTGPAELRPARRRGSWFAIVRVRRGAALALSRIVLQRRRSPELPISGSVGAPERLTGDPEPGPLHPGTDSIDRAYRPDRCALNAYPLDRLDPSSPWQWPASLDRPDSARQRVRQSGKRRYR